VTVYVPTVTDAENRPSAPTEMPVLAPFGPCRVICPARARGPVPGDPPTAWSLPVTVPSGPGGTVGDEQLASVIPPAMTASKISEIRRTVFLRSLVLARPLVQRARRRSPTWSGCPARVDAPLTDVHPMGPACLRCASAEPGRWRTGIRDGMASRRAPGPSAQPPIQPIGPPPFSDAAGGAVPDKMPAATATPAIPGGAAARENFRFMRTLSFLLPCSGQAAATHDASIWWRPAGRWRGLLVSRFGRLRAR
jgi:hypothetical protein